MINAYDFDGTIYDGDSSVDFYLFCLKKNKKILLQLPVQIFGLILYILGFIEKTEFKEKVFSYLKRINNIDDYVKEFWQINDKKIKSWYLKQKKTSDVIISASPEFLLNPMKKKLKIDRVIASKTNKKTGRFESKNCHDYEKIKRYEEIYKNKKIKEFYSDSVKADRAMLEYAEEAYLVKKDEVTKIDIKNYKINPTSKLTKLFLMIFIATFLIVLFGTLFDNKVVLDVATTKNNIISLIIACILLFLISTIKIKGDCKKRVIFTLGLLMIITMQILVIIYAKNSPGWDWKVVYQSALDFVNGKLDGASIWYFNTFPNNKYLFAIQVILFKLLKIFGILKYSLTATHIVNIICVDISILFTLLTVKKLYGKNNLLIATLLILLSSAFYIYLPIFYSDTSAMPIPIILIYLFISMDRIDEKICINKRNIILSIIFSTVAILGIKLKVTSILVFIAIIVCMIINKKVKKHAKIIILITLILTVELFSLKFIESKINFFVSTNGNSLPYTHWVMMGLYEAPSNVKGKKYIGVYNEKLYNYSFKLGTRENIIAGNKKRIIKKLKQYGPIGYIKFLYRKCLFAWGDGTFHGSRMISENKLVKNNIIQEFICCSGKYFKYYYLINTAILFIMYISFIVGGIDNIKNNNCNNTIVYMSIYGLLFFLLIWEASARYLVHYVPVLVVGSIPGINVLQQKISKGLKK